MVSVADIIVGMTTGAGSTGDYGLIQNKINQAIAYITAGTAISATASGDSLSEECTIYKNSFFVTARTNDYQITNIYGYDFDGNQTVLTALDYVKIGSNHFTIVNAVYQRVRVEYTSNYISWAINELIKEIAEFEFLRLPKKTGALNKSNEGAGTVSINYSTPAEFYIEIDRKLDRLILRF